MRAMNRRRRIAADVRRARSKPRHSGTPRRAAWRQARQDGAVAVGSVTAESPGANESAEGT